MSLVYTLTLCVCVHVSALFGVYVGEMMSSYHAIIPAFGLPGAPLSKNITNNDASPALIHYF